MKKARFETFHIANHLVVNTDKITFEIFKDLKRISYASHLADFINFEYEKSEEKIENSTRKSLSTVLYLAVHWPTRHNARCILSGK